MGKPEANRHHRMAESVRTMKNYNKSRLGMAFEEQVERSNAMYRRRGQALVVKLHTEVQVKTKKGAIVGGKFGEKSSVDFVGLANGVPVAFDAKSTNELLKLPYSNIAPHQIDFMNEFQLQGGKSFLLVHFNKHHKTYLITFEQLTKYMSLSKVKYIAYEYFKQHCKLVHAQNLVECDWLSALY